MSFPRILFQPHISASGTHVTVKVRVLNGSRAYAEVTVFLDSDPAARPPQFNYPGANGASEEQAIEQASLIEAAQREISVIEGYMERAERGGRTRVDGLKQYVEDVSE